jgi:hypothetical protein
MTVRPPPRRRHNRGTDPLQLATAEPSRIVRGRLRQPRVNIAAAGPDREHYIEAAAEERPRHRAVVANALTIVAQLAGEQRAQLDRTVVRRDRGERWTGPIKSGCTPTGSHPQL